MFLKSQERLDAIKYAEEKGIYLDSVEFSAYLQGVISFYVKVDNDFYEFSFIAPDESFCDDESVESLLDSWHVDYFKFSHYVVGDLGEPKLFKNVVNYAPKA